MRKLLLPLLLATSLSAHSAEDKWSGSDKPVHFGVSFILGFAAGNQFPDNKPLAFGLAMLPGVAKEFSDRSTTGFSYKDLTFNAAGALLGVYSAHWLITRSEGKTYVSYSTSF